jgi:hypothetical protein
MIYQEKGKKNIQVLLKMKREGSTDLFAEFVMTLMTASLMILMTMVMTDIYLKYPIIEYGFLLSLKKRGTVFPCKPDQKLSEDVYNRNFRWS